MGPLSSVYLWHSKLGSINKHRLQQIQKNIFYGIFLFNETSLNFCELVMPVCMASCMTTGYGHAHYAF